MAEPRDPYRVLGVDPTAPHREIRDAYRRRARMAHPDLAGEEGASWMRDLNAAWDLLKSPERRAAHDAGSGGSPAVPNQGSGPHGSDSAAGAPPFASSRERWHGAAGAPPGRAFGTVLQVGIYAGWSLGQVAGRDRGYLAWLRDRPEGRPYAAEIDRILRTATAAPAADARPGRQRRR
ncbi:MAG: DnaJ domain-containing protein [Chloroflexi bacterium]|nr:DnaJ domain-containing protein [Chloroflexota bacterium]